jgi:ribosome maturation protein Sdo1
MITTIDLQFTKCEYMMKNNWSVEENIEYCLKQLEHIKPKKPQKPILKMKHSVEDVQKYLEDLEKFGKLEQDYKEANIYYNTSVCAVHEELIKYIKEVSGLNEYVPEQYRENVFDYASENTYEWFATYEKLFDLINIFTKGKK